MIGIKHLPMTSRALSTLSSSAVNRARSVLLFNNQLSSLQRNFTSRTLPSASIKDQRDFTLDQPFSIDSKHFSSTTENDETKVHPADGKFDYGYMTPDEHRFVGHKPTINYARSMPTQYSLMRNEQILQLCVEGNFSARREALIRNVMAVDSIEYDDAVNVVLEMSKYNRKYMEIHYFPYKLGLGTAIVGGIASFPLVFDVNSVKWFNHKYVTMDVPEPRDLETFLEVGSWSWSWMEPVLGQVSFLLLVLQFSRSQLINLGIRPFGDKMKSIRADGLVQQFPKYNDMYVRWYSEGDTLYGG